MQFYKRRANFCFIGLDSVQITTRMWQKVFSVEKPATTKIIDLVTFKEIKVATLEDALETTSFLCVIYKPSSGRTKASIYSQNSSKSLEHIGSLTIDDGPKIFQVNVPID